MRRELFGDLFDVIRKSCLSHRVRIKGKNTKNPMHLLYLFFFDGSHSDDIEVQMPARQPHPCSCLMRTENTFRRLSSLFYFQLEMLPWPRAP